MAKPTTKKKPMTLEDFAAAVHKDYLAISTHMATKKDIRAIREEMATREDVRKIREEMATKEKLADVSDRISVAKDELQEQIAGLRYAKEIDALAERLKLVEEKLGLRPTHRAA
jgi:SpoVK/Ycf46/Vps4 family AAA+-type ATPase